MPYHRVVSDVSMQLSHVCCWTKELRQFSLQLPEDNLQCSTRKYMGPWYVQLYEWNRVKTQVNSDSLEKKTKDLCWKIKYRTEHLSLGSDTIVLKKNKKKGKRVS